MTLLRGPADADNFRVKVGRYGDRWYTDPLPADDIAEPTDEVFPSVSTCKKASGSDWSFVALKRVASALENAPYSELAGMPYDHRYEALKTINKLGLESAGRRGTNVHLMAEAHLYGRLPSVGPADPGYEYEDSVDQFFTQYQPTLIAAEFVCIHRTLNGAGYGGTSDAIVEIDGKRYLVDWKSRGADSEHGAYPEEAAQIAAYARADYIIVEGPNGSERQRVPELDGGLIISIKPDGCRVYPVDLDQAFTHWTALHAWWVARQNERAAVGRQWAARKTAVPAKATLNPDPSQGGPVDAWDDIKASFDLLPAEAKKWRGTLVNAAQRHNVPFHVQEVRTERTWWLNRGVTALAHHSPDDDTLRALLALLLKDVAFDPSVEAGHLLGSLDHKQARLFSGHVERFVADPAA